MIGTKSNDKIRWIWNDYSKLERVGQGQYGKVYKAINKLTGGIVAVKATPTDNDGILATTLREVVILRTLNHENIVK